MTSETQTILIELETKRNEVLGILKGQGIKANVEGPLIVVELESGEQYDALRDAIAGSEARLRRLTPRRHTLSEVFQDTVS